MFLIELLLVPVHPMTMKSPSLRAGFSLFALLALLGAAGSGPAYLVEDINVGRGDSSLGGALGTISLGDRAMLSVSSLGGMNLWMSDGTAEGTRAVEVPAFGFSWPTAFLGSVFFFTESELHGSELWKSDGTPSGTRLVKDIRPGPHGSAGVGLTVFRGAIYFAADDGTNGSELWRSDGTPEGTRLLADLRPGPLWSSPREFTVVRDQLLFFGPGASNAGPYGLWRTDGTAEGTILIRTFTSELFGRYNTVIPPEGLNEIDGTAYFFANDGLSGSELWKTDGTAEGTALVRDVRPGPVGGCIFFSDSDPPTGLGGKILFAGDDGQTGLQLWASDGTSEGTSSLGGAGARNVTAVGRFAYFTAFDPQSGVELWRTDGTREGTAAVRDIAPGAQSSFPRNLTGFGDLLLFDASDGSDGQELWVSDGSPSGTRLLKDIVPGPGGSNPGPLGRAGSRLLFAAHDPSALGIWRTDGTESGTERFAVLQAAGTNSSIPTSLTALRDEVLFVAWETSNRITLWRSDGSAEGTHAVSDAVVVELYTKLTPFNGAVYFSGRDDPSSSPELWKSDGTAEGTIRLREIQLSGRSVSAGGRLYFSAYDAAHGFELWSTDGTPEGTRIVKEVRPGPEGAEITGLAALGNQIFFTAGKTSGPAELWTSDGTETGTFPVTTFGIDSGGRAVGYDLVAFGGSIFFTVRNGDVNVPSPQDLWVTNGTAEGTRRIRSFRLIRHSYVPAGGRLFFSADDGEHGFELWTTDGTESGTALVRDIFPGSSDAIGPLPGIQAIQNLLFFAASDGTRGTELWRSDGSLQGTVMVRDINPGASSSNPADFADVGGLLAFSATDGLNGIEPWVSNGAEAGTRILQDVLSGAGSSRARFFTRSGGRVYFAANGGASGIELWAVPLSAIQAATGRAIHAPRLLPFRP